MQRLVLVPILICGMAVSGGAQTKISGKISCARTMTPDTGAVGDMPGHLLMFDKATCTWSQPITIAGAKATTATEVSTSEIRGAAATLRGYNTSTYDNGDKATARYEGPGTLNADGSGKFTGKWTFVGGTGTLSGIKGGGTFSASGAADGSTVADISGHYTISGKGKGKAKKAM